MNQSRHQAGVLILMAAAALLALLLVGALVTAVGGSSSTIGSVESSTICVTRGNVPGLSAIASQNARIVAATAINRAGSDAALIVLTVGITESGLRILGNPNDAAGKGLPDQGTGTDHNSLGIFQQRPSWGSAAERMDPVASTNLFLDRLVALTDWQSAAPWVDAQHVQVSAWDGRARAANNYSSVVGGNYATQVPEAARVLGIILRDTVAQDCTDPGGSNVGDPPPGPTTAFGLPMSYTVPASASAAGRIAVLAALSVLGRPYVFGAAGPDAFDCSGLTAWAWARARVSLPHYTVAQWHAGGPTDPAHLTPGDLVLTPGSDGTVSDPQHVGMFLGDGLVVEAPQTGDVIRVVSYSSFVSGGLAGLRHIG
jgi:cell wall-associated NlpC family hydrolase